MMSDRLILSVLLLGGLIVSLIAGPLQADVCDDYTTLSGYGVIGERIFQSGNNSTINGNDITGSGNTPTPTGNMTTIDENFPALTPATFPATGGANQSSRNSFSLSAGSYGTVALTRTNRTLTMSGGDYFISDLRLEANGDTLVMAPGNYYVERFYMDQSTNLVLSGSGQVNIYIKQYFQAGNQVSLNAGGDVGNLVIYLYSAATFQVGNANQGNSGLDFSGIIYSPYENTSIQFGNNNDIEGAILSEGTVQVGNNTDFTYSSDTEAAVNEAFGCSIIEPLAEWRFDEFSWGDVEDSSGNGYSGIANNGAYTDDTSPAIAGVVGTCGYGVFDGDDDYVAFPALPELTDSFTLTAWIRPNRIDRDQRIFVDDSNNSGGFALSLGDGGDGRLRFFSRGVSPIILDSGPVVSALAWQHVAVVHDADTKSRRIYFNGSQVAADSYTGNWGTDGGAAAVGGEIDGNAEANPNYRFDGFIDEVRVYQQALGVSRINQIKDETRACPQPSTPIAYFELDEFSLDGSVGEIADNQGFAVSARAVNTANGVAPNAEGKICYGVDIPENTDSSQYAIDTGVDVDDDIGNRGSISFWYRNNEAWNSGDARWLFDATKDNNPGNDPYFSFYIKNDGRLRFGLEDINDGDMRRDTVSAFAFGAGTWTHLAVTWDLANSNYQIFVNGVSQAVTKPNDTLSSSAIGELDTLYFGDERSTSYNPDNIHNSANGRFDEIRIYNEAIERAQVVADMNATHGCNVPPPDGNKAFAFNCMQAGQDAVSGKLYTRVAGSAFTFDVVALRDGNDDGTADAVETDFAKDADRDVTVELVDTSSGGACASLPALTPAVSQTLSFTAADAGRKAAVSMAVNKVYRSVGCRVTDAGDSPAVVGCSTDSFAIRPATIALATPVLNNATATGTPKAAAGSGFTLSVNTLAGYDGTPQIAGSLDANTAATPGTLSGSFAAADPATGTASGDAFSYSEVGNFRFQAGAIRDSGFTAVDQNTDCVDDSFSNTPNADGKVGCDFANSTATDWVGRFTPHHFDIELVDSGMLVNNCGTTFSYAGLPIAMSSDPQVRITARNLAGQTTLNYHDFSGSGGANYAYLPVAGDYAVSTTATPAFPLVVTDNNQAGAVSGNVSLSIDDSSADADSGSSFTMATGANGVFSSYFSGLNFVYDKVENNLVAPFTPLITLNAALQVSDGDGVSSSASLVITPADNTVNAVAVRFGRLAMSNAYGSELKTLPMRMQVEYFNGVANGFVANTDDSCSTVNNVVITDSVADELAVSETCIWDSAGNSGAFACASAGEAADQYQATPLAADFNLNLQAPGAGNTGVLNVTADAPAYLEYDWNGDGITDDPSATASFGLHNRGQRRIFLKEVR